MAKLTQFPVFVKTNDASDATAIAVAEATAAKFGGKVLSNTAKRFFIVSVNQPVELFATVEQLKAAGLAELNSLVTAADPTAYYAAMRAIVVAHGHESDIPAKSACVPGGTWKIHSRTTGEHDAKRCNPVWAALRDLLANRAKSLGGIMLLPYHPGIQPVFGGRGRKSGGKLAATY